MKLIELDCEPLNVQIVLQGKDEVVHTFYLLMIMELFAQVCTYVTTTNT